jgi:hypothetical protein
LVLKPSEHRLNFPIVFQLERPLNSIRTIRMGMNHAMKPGARSNGHRKIKTKLKASKPKEPEDLKGGLKGIGAKPLSWARFRASKKGWRSLRAGDLDRVIWLGIAHGFAACTSWISRSRELVLALLVDGYVFVPWAPALNDRPEPMVWPEPFVPLRPSPLPGYGSRLRGPFDAVVVVPSDDGLVGL